MELLDRSTTAPPASPYIYYPTAWLAVVAAIAFALVASAHGWFLFHHRAWFFWAMLVGSLMELVGFVARAISAQHLDNAYAFIVQHLALLLAPSFLAAACYTVFGRIVWWVTPKSERTFRTLWCPPRHSTLLFVAFDLGSFFIQLLGASSSARAVQDTSLGTEEQKSKREQGLNTLRVGLVLQLLCFALFGVVGVRFLVVSRRWTSSTFQSTSSMAQWQRLNWTVTLAAVLILLRTIYRIFEFTDASPSYIVSHEWLFWVLDGLPVLVLLGLAIIHPARYLPLEFQKLRINRRALQKLEESSPPSYSLA